MKCRSQNYRLAKSAKLVVDKNLKKGNTNDETVLLYNIMIK